MDRSEVTRLLDLEIKRCPPFENWHGITSQNIGSCLIEPSRVEVDPDDLETEPRSMWLVMREPSAREGSYFVAYDEHALAWAIVEPSAESGYVQIISAKTLASALEAM